MNPLKIAPERALNVIVGLLLVGAVLPCIASATANTTAGAAGAGFGFTQALLAVGLVKRARLALVLTQLLTAAELFMFLLAFGGFVIARGGTVYAGYHHTSLYTESPAIALPLMVGAFLLTYWEWRMLGRADLAAQFRRATLSVPR